MVWVCYRIHVQLYRGHGKKQIQHKGKLNIIHVWDYRAVVGLFLEVSEVQSQKAMLKLYGSESLGPQRSARSARLGTYSLEGETVVSHSDNDPKTNKKTTEVALCS